MVSHVVVLKGLSELARGELFILNDNTDVLLGRSRECGISYQRFRPWLALSEADRRLRDHYNNAVSRKHLNLRAEGKMLHLNNLSGCGTMVNNVLLTQETAYDLSKGPLTIRIGLASEIFSAELMEAAVAHTALTQLPPLIEDHRHPGVPDLTEDPTPKKNQALRK
jgi:pSer/pThr/pTyr-binding forkhead associated (FHA) protein